MKVRKNLTKIMNYFKEALSTVKFRKRIKIICTCMNMHTNEIYVSTM